MVPRDFNPNQIMIRCRVCNKPHPKSDFPTFQRVCRDCAEKMHWVIPDHKGRRPKSMLQH